MISQLVSGWRNRCCVANNLGIIHPALLGSLVTNFYPSACTIQRATESRDSFGQVLYAWSNLAGHVGLACSVALSRGERSDERETTEQTYSVERRRIALNGVYGSIVVKDRAVVGAVTYDIERVTTDSQGKTTYLDVQVVV